MTKLRAIVMLVTLILWAAAGCSDVPDDDQDGPSPTAVEMDVDGDGFDADIDCDDEDPSVYPGADELCDTVDNDCDDRIDDDPIDGGLLYPDTDGDGFGAPGLPLEACEGQEGYVENSEDCDDEDSDTHPGAEEPCDEAIDRNCDGSIGYEDRDHDGVPACASGGDDPAGQGDCDDADAAVYPGATEQCDGKDNDCDEATSPAGGEEDADWDGAFACEDCDDTDPDRFPGNDETCDGKDNDCNDSTWAFEGEFDQDVDGFTNCDDCDDDAADVYPGALEACDGRDNDCDDTTWAEGGEEDGDGDGVVSCEDCDDGAGDVYPGALEVCDGVDNDCDDGQPDGGVDEDGDTTYYRDNDGDGHGNPDETTLGCQATEGYVELGDDCDDEDPSIWPGAPDPCDGVDNDCDEGEPDGGVDEDGDTIFYRDNDGDGHGDPEATLLGCQAPEGYVDLGDDCDDNAADVYPGALEVCDGVDNDCDDGQPDGGVDEDGESTFYQDGDGDGHGNPEATLVGCMAPDGYVTPGDDCDDTDPNRSPENLEVCDGQDNDCDDETWAGDGETDGDEDGALACEDCDDGDPDRTPGSGEVCDGVDNDCDGDVPASEKDGDGDGFTPCGAGTEEGDCDDGNGVRFPGNPEICDGFDNDCDGVISSAELDDDGDGYRECSSDGETGDCDDNEASVNPGAEEVCDMPGPPVDNDCDGEVSSDEVDDDGDGMTECEGDCDDAAPDVYEGAPEVCDGKDNDCDDQTQADEVDEDGDGWLACGSDEVPADCDDEDPDNHPENLEVCDGRDNDCDGEIESVEGLEVGDGTLESGADLLFQYSPVTEGDGFIKANWTGTTNVDGYEAAVGTNPGEADVMDWADVGAETSGTFSGLDLQGAWEDTTYYVSIRAYVGGAICGFAATSNGVMVAEAEVFTGSADELRPRDGRGGFTRDWPEADADAIYGDHFFESIVIAEESAVYVQGWGRAQNVSAGIGSDDAAVLEPADGWVALYANDISIDGVITASGRGYGGGGGGASTCGTGATPGEGGAGGLGGAGGKSGGDCATPGAGGGGGGSPGGVGNNYGGDGTTFGGGGGSSGQRGNDVGGDGGYAGGGSSPGHAGAVGEVGGTGVSPSINNPRGGDGGSGEFTPGGGGGGGAQNASSAGGGGGGYGGGGGGGNENAGGGGGGGSGGYSPASGASTTVGAQGAGPFGGTGGDMSNCPAQPGDHGGYAEAGGNGDTTTDRSVRLGGGGGGGGGDTGGQSAGGGGGAGGGAITLYAYDDLVMSGTGKVLSNGAGGGGGGRDDNSCRVGGSGGRGAGGGILLEAYSLTIEDADTAHVSARGADGDPANGGTIKLFYGSFTGERPDSGNAGRVYDAGAGSFR